MIPMIPQAIQVTQTMMRTKLFDLKPFEHISCSNRTTDSLVIQIQVHLHQKTTVTNRWKDDFWETFRSPWSDVAPPAGARGDEGRWIDAEMPPKLI